MEVLQAKNLKKIYGSGNNAVHALDGVDSVSYTHLTLPTNSLV